MTKGIDLASKHGDIRRIIAKYFALKIHHNGLDFDDVLQDVFVKIASSNLGEHPFDPSKSSMSHYVFLVTNSILRNKHRASKQRSFVTLGMTGLDGETVDAAEAAEGLIASETTFESEHAAERLAEAVAKQQGYTLNSPEADALLALAWGWTMAAAARVSAVRSQDRGDHRDTLLLALGGTLSLRCEDASPAYRPKRIGRLARDGAPSQSPS